MDVPKFYKVTALPASPTASDDGVYFVRANSSVGYIAYIITNGIAVQQDAVTTASLLAITGVLGNLTTNAKTSLVDAINEVNGSIGSLKSKTVTLTGAYRRTVIPLCLLDNTNIELNSYFYGNVYVKRNNSLGYRSIKAAIEVAKMYNETNPIIDVSLQVPPVDSIFRPVTFLYNGLKYFGLEVGSSGATFQFAIVDGFANDWAVITPVDYFNTQTSTIINSEINGSIAEYVYVNDNYNKIEKSLFKVQAQTFLKTGKDDTTIMLSGGGDRAVSDFALVSALSNYALLSQVYTQSQSLGLFVPLAGVASISGTKTFVDAPVVPAGSIDSHAVNLGQVKGLVMSGKQNLGLGPSAGSLTITDGLGTSLRSIFVMNKSDANVSLYTGGGLEVNVNTSGSTNYPSDTGAMISLKRTDTSTGGSFQIWKAVSDDNKLKFRTGSSGTGFNAWQTFISEETVTSLLSNKVDKIAGKQLSTEDYTSAEKAKLAGVQAGAEVNVNADWNAVSGDAQILNKPVIPTVNNPTMTFQGAGAITGGGSFTLNQTGAVSYSFDLLPGVKTDIQSGAAAGALIGQFVSMFKFHNKTGGGSVDPAGVYFTLVGTGGVPGFTIDIQDHNVHGARLVLQRNDGSGITRYNINAVNYALISVGFINVETISREYEWDSDISKWREVF